TSAGKRPTLRDPCGSAAHRFASQRRAYPNLPGALALLPALLPARLAALLAALLAAGGPERQGQLRLSERPLVRDIGEVRANRAAHQLGHRQIQRRGPRTQRIVKVRG